MNPTSGHSQLDKMSYSTSTSPLGSHLGNNPLTQGIFSDSNLITLHGGHQPHCFKLLYGSHHDMSKVCFSSWTVGGCGSLKETMPWMEKSTISHPQSLFTALACILLSIRKWGFWFPENTFQFLWNYPSQRWKIIRNICGFGMLSFLLFPCALYSINMYDITTIYLRCQ